MIVVVAVVVAILFFMRRCSTKETSREGYRDPIYLNRKKYTSDYYPRSNGSIYGFPYGDGGSWNIFSGFPMYWRAY